MHVSGSQVKEIQLVHCTCSKVIVDKHRQGSVCSAVSGYFAVQIPLFFFATIVSPFGAGAAPFFTAPASSNPFRRLRLRLRIPAENIVFFSDPKGGGRAPAPWVRPCRLGLALGLSQARWAAQLCSGLACLGSAQFGSWLDTRLDLTKGSAWGPGVIVGTRQERNS